jgi:6-phosphogluconolactonase (cycloisomerase 2 family)
VRTCSARIAAYLPLLVLVLSCSGPSAGPSLDLSGNVTTSAPAPTPTPAPPAGTGHMLYTANSGLDSIGIYSVAPGTGALTFQATVSTGSGSKPQALAVTPNHKFLYAADHGSDKISSFSIDQTTGYLTLISHLGAYSQPYSMTINAAGTFLFVNFEGSKTTVSYSINGTTGALTETANYGYGGSPVPTSIAIHPNDTFAVGATNSFVHPYSVNGTGTLNSISTTYYLWFYDLKFSPNGLWLAAADATTHRVYTWSVDVSNGTPLSNVRLNDTSSLMGPTAVIWDLTGAYVYSANWWEHQVEAFSLATGTGILTSLGTVTVGTSCQNKSLALDPDGAYLFSACSTSGGGIASYKVNANGTLTASGSATLTNAAILGMATVKLF